MRSYATCSPAAGACQPGSNGKNAGMPDAEGGGIVEDGDFVAGNALSALWQLVVVARLGVLARAV